MTSLKVVDIKKPVNPDVVKAAEDLLEKARAGEIVDLAWCASTPDNAAYTHFTATKNSLVRLASVARLLHRLNLNLDPTEIQE